MPHWKIILRPALLSFPFAMGLFAVLGIFRTVVLFQDDAISDILFALFAAIMFVVSIPLFLPVFLFIVPWIALIPVVAILASSVAVRVQTQPDKVLFSIWFVAWGAVFLSAILSGNITA